MIKSSLSPQEAIDVLNGALELDREAMSQLLRQRVPCNQALADHPTLQVGRIDDDPSKSHEVCH